MERMLKMKKTVTGCITTGFVFIGLFLFMPHANATALDVKVQSEDQDSNIGIQAKQYLKEGNVSIRKPNINTVLASCDSSSYSNVQQISCTTYLDVKNRSTGKWTYTGQSYRFTNRYTAHVSGSVRFTIVRGYEYRIRSIHTVSHNGILENLGAATPGLQY